MAVMKEVYGTLTRIFVVLIFSGSLLFYPSVSLADETIPFTNDVVEQDELGAAALTVVVAQPFTPSSDATAFDLKFRYFVADPSGGSGSFLVLTIEGDSGGHPDGSAIYSDTSSYGYGSAPADCASASDSDTGVQTLSLTAGVTYWVVFSYSGVTPVRYGICGSSTATQVAVRYRSGAWSNAVANALYQQIILTNAIEGGGAFSPASTTPMTYQENMFVAGVLLFFVSLMGWGYIFRPLTPL